MVDFTVYGMSITGVGDFGQFVAWSIIGVEDCVEGAFAMTSILGFCFLNR